MAERGTLQRERWVPLVAGMHADLVQTDGGCGRVAALRRLAEALGWRGVRWQIRCQDELIQEAAWPESGAFDGETRYQRAGARLGHKHTWAWIAGGGEPDSDEVHALLDALADADQLAERVAAALGVAAAPEQGDSEAGFATVTSSGVVIACDGRFKKLVQQEFGAWDERRLPFEAGAEDDFSQHGRVLGRLWLRIRPQGQYLHISMRPDRRAATISPREYDIAARIADGKTFREVANDLELAPSTVSTHVYNLYAKLGLKKRSELVRWFAQQGIPEQG